MARLLAPAFIESSRLRIRQVTEADVPALMEVNCNPEVTALLPYATWSSLDDGMAWYERVMRMQATGLAWQFVIECKASGAVIGTCLLFRLEEGSARAELGYVLGRPYWGQGIMREALTALLDAAFGEMGLRRIEAEVMPRNLASAALLLRLGFTKEGLLRQRWMTKGQPEDVGIYGLLRAEWLARSSTSS